MRPDLINRLKEEWNNLDPVDPLRGLIADAIDALVEQPAQQEPVAWLHPANATCVTTDPTAYARGIPLYTSPPAQRTWVGLTDDEILYCVELENPKAIAEEVEAKLKEKNT